MPRLGTHTLAGTGAKVTPSPPKPCVTPLPAQLSLCGMAGHGGGACTRPLPMRVLREVLGTANERLKLLTGGRQESSSPHSCLQMPRSWTRPLRVRKGALVKAGALPGTPRAPQSHPARPLPFAEPAGWGAGPLLLALYQGRGGYPGQGAPPCRPNQPPDGTGGAVVTSGQTTVGYKVRGVLLGGVGCRDRGGLSACPCTAPAVAPEQPLHRGQGPCGSVCGATHDFLVLTGPTWHPPALGILETPSMGCVSLDEAIR